MLSRVDFPEPDGPMMAMNSPCGILNVTPLRTSVSTLPRRKDLVRLVASIIMCMLHPCDWRRLSGRAPGQAGGRVEMRRLARRLHAKDETHHGACDECDDEGQPGDPADDQTRRVETPCGDKPNRHANDTADQRNENGFEEKLLRNIPGSGANGTAQADFARALRDSDQHQVHDHEATADQRHK